MYLYKGCRHNIEPRGYCEENQLETEEEGRLKMEIVRRKAEEAEERGRYREDKGLYTFALISYTNAKLLYEEAGKTKKVTEIEGNIRRVKSLLNLYKFLLL